MHGITRCPNCQTAFKVAHSQLAIAKGRVRCSKCKHPFQASDYWLATSYDASDPQLIELNANLASPQHRSQTSWLISIIFLGILGLLLQYSWHFPGRSAHYVPGITKLFNLAEQWFAVPSPNVIDLNDLNLTHVIARNEQQSHTLRIDGRIENHGPTEQKTPDLLVNLISIDGSKHQKIVKTNQIQWQYSHIPSKQSVQFNLLLNISNLQVIDYSTSLCCQP